MKLGFIGNGAITRYALGELQKRGHEIGAILVRPERLPAQPGLLVDDVDHLPQDLDLVIDCAGHSALACFGPTLLARGTHLLTVSLGALADADLHAQLQASALAGNSRLHLASGAIGALDCLRAAAVGKIDSVCYTGRKPPQGWKGSPAEDSLSLDELPPGAHCHFEGSARDAALAYPKNANVAAAVALAGTGFDNTRVQLLADTNIDANIHEIRASGEFGEFHFQLSGHTLPDNPRTSALAAMSTVSKIDQLSSAIVV